MPFDFHDFDRIKNLAEELRELRYRNLRNIPSFRFWEDSDRESRVCAKEVGPGFSFRGWDKYYWLTAAPLREPEITGTLKACSI